LNLLAIDPGLKTGLAVYLNDKLRMAIGMKLDDVLAGGFQVPTVVHNLVIEQPQIWMHSPAGNSQIMKLALHAGILLQYFRSAGIEHVHYMFPVQWKVNVPNPIVFQQIKNLLTTSEQEVFDLCKSPDGKCAIGIGMVFLKRARPGIV
jgi:hypothetical protein